MKFLKIWKAVSFVVMMLLALVLIAYPDDSMFNRRILFTIACTAIGTYAYAVYVLDLES